jgi:probable HAF family extracellular repeat protein
LTLERLEERCLLSYTVTDLGTLGDYTQSQASAINAQGDVAGSSFTDGYAADAFLYSGGSVTDLGSLGGPKTYANSLNSADQVVGSSTTPDGFPHPFLYSDGVMADLGTLGGDYGVALGINEAGQVTGYSTTAEGASHAFLYSDGGMSDLGGASSIGHGINAYGQVAGSGSVGNFIHAFLYSDGAITDLGLLSGGTYSQAFALNDAGIVVGQSSTGDSPSHAFLYQDGQMSDLGTLGGQQSEALAINNAGQVVGYATDLSNAVRGFLWDSGTMIDLNSLIAPDAPYIITGATGINDSGQIVGYGYVLPQYDIHGFLLTPDSGGSAPVNHHLATLATEMAGFLPRPVFPSSFSAASQPTTPPGSQGPAEVVMRWDTLPPAGYSQRLDSPAHLGLTARCAPGPMGGVTSLFEADSPLLSGPPTPAGFAG